MLPDLPDNALITADCGFVGYEFWRELLDRKLEFVIRVGGNVRLLTQLGWFREVDGTVYLWPDKAARGGQPPLVLRLVVVHGLEPDCLSVAKMLKAFGHALRGTVRKLSLADALQNAVQDPYQRRDKRSRGYPRKKYEPPTKPPKIQPASQLKRDLAKKIKKKAVEKGLTA